MGSGTLVRGHSASPLVALAGGGALVLVLRLLAAGAMFLLQFVLSRTLGVGGFGMYAYTLAWVQLLAVFGKGGLEITSVRYVCEHAARGETALLAGFLQRSRMVGLGLSLAIAAGLAGVAWLAPALRGTELRSCLLLGAVILPVMTTRLLSEAQLRAMGRVWQGTISFAVWPLLLIVLVTGGEWMGTGPATAVGVLALHLSSLLLASALVAGFRRRAQLSSGRHVPSDHRMRQWGRSAGVFLAFELAVILKGRTGVTLAGLVEGPEAAGLYAMAERFSEVVLLGVQSLTLFAAPRFATLYASGEWRSLRRVVRGTQRLGLAFAVPAAGALMIFGQPLLGFLDDGFRAGYDVLVILLISTVTLAISGPAAYVLSMSGREGFTLTVTLVCAVVNVLLSLFLLPVWGIIGLGIAHVAASAAWTTFMMSRVRWLLASAGREPDERSRGSRRTHVPARVRPLPR